MNKYLLVLLVVTVAISFMAGCNENPKNIGTIMSESPQNTNTSVNDKTAEKTGNKTAGKTPSPDAAAEKTVSPKTDAVITSPPKTSGTITQKPTPTPPLRKPLSGFVIGLDPGHQGKGNSEQEPVAPGSSVTKKKVSSGTQGRWTRIPEYQVVLEVGMKLKGLLEEQGAIVIMSRQTNDTDISNAQRATMMNDKNTDIVLRIHINGNQNPEVYGACMLIPSGENNKNIHSVSSEAGKIILDEFCSATGAKNNGIVKRSDLTGFNWSTVPVCLVEMGYMSNKEEDYKLTSEDYKNKCAEGLYNGIRQYLLK